MINYEELNKAIDASGLKKVFIAEKIGLTPKTFCDRVQGKTKWKHNEVIAFCQCLNLTKKERELIFLANC